MQLRNTSAADVQLEISNKAFSNPLKWKKKKRHFNTKSQYSFVTVYSAVRIFLLEKSKGCINLSQFLMVFYGHFVQNPWGLGVTYLSLHRSTRKIQLNALCENPTHTAVKKQQESNSICIGPWIVSRAERLYLPTFSYCNYSSQVWYTSFTSIAPTLLDLQTAWNPAYLHVKKRSPILQRATATLLRSMQVRGTLRFQYCQQSKNFNSKPLKFVWTWWAFVGVAFFFVCFWLTVSFIVLKFTDFQMKKMVSGSLDSQSHITVKLYTEPCAGETTTFQLLPAQLYTLQMKEKDVYLEFIFKLACNQMQLKNSTSM